MMTNSETREKNGERMAKNSEQQRKTAKTCTNHQTHLNKKTWVIFGSFWGTLGVILGSFWGVIWGPC